MTWDSSSPGGGIGSSIVLDDDAQRGIYCELVTMNITLRDLVRSLDELRKQLDNGRDPILAKKRAP